MPAILGEELKMRFHNGTELSNAYKIFGVDPEKGAVVVVRPDGYIGTIAELGGIERLAFYLRGCLRETVK